MAKNHLLSAPVRARIDQRVERILRELGSPAPPLRLEDVRELLKLNLSYFSGDDDGLLSSLVSRLKIAGKQVLKRPMLLAEAVKTSTSARSTCLTEGASCSTTPSRSRSTAGSKRTKSSMTLCRGITPFCSATTNTP